MVWSQDCGGAQHWVPWENEAPLQEIKGEGKSLAFLWGLLCVLHDSGPVSALLYWLESPSSWKIVRMAESNYF